MNVEDYLKKIGCADCIDAEPSLATLTKLVRGNLSQFPFENLDMHMGEFRKFSLEDAYDRLMNQQLGGYCIQLNGVFAWLLRQLKYEVSLHPAYVFNHFLKRFSRLPVHVVMVVRFEDGRIYYVDVGTTRLVNEPIEIKEGVDQIVQLGIFKFTKSPEDPEFLVLQRAKWNSDEWTTQIKFSPQDSHEFSYFKDMNDWVQTEEHMTIFYRTVAFRHVSLNRFIYLVGRKFTEVEMTSDFEEKQTVRMIDDDEELHSMIRDKFGLKIDFDRFKPVDELEMRQSQLNHN